MSNLARIQYPADNTTKICSSQERWEAWEDEMVEVRREVTLFQAFTLLLSLGIMWAAVIGLSTWDYQDAVAQSQRGQSYLQTDFDIEVRR